MKKIIAFILIVFSGFVAKSQTVIPATTTVDSLSKMAKGSYRFFRVNKDTVDMSKDTIPKCPACPAPIVCPVCPPIPAPRTVVSFCYDAINKRTVFTYQDGTTSTL